MPKGATPIWTHPGTSCKDAGMTKDKSKKLLPKTGETREDRLKSALKANLARRKAQMRAKAAQSGASDEETKKA